MKGPVFLHNPDPAILNPGKYDGRQDEYDIIMRIGVKPKKKYVRKFDKPKDQASTAYVSRQSRFNALESLTQDPI